MQRRSKPLVPISVIVFVIVAIIGFSCKFSFADFKRPDKGSVNFGAAEKPEIKSPPQAAGFKTLFADIAEKVIPTVVSVIPTKIDTVVFYNNPFYRFFDDDQFGDGQGSPFDFFFGPQYQQPQQRQRRQQQQQQPQAEKKEFRRSQGLGSGVVVSKDGYILTNNHVVAGADEIEIKTSDGKTYQAELVGTDSLSDLAVIKIKDKVDNLHVAYIGDSDKLRPGDWVMAVGNPFSLTSTVTVGIVSALGRNRVREDNPNAYQNYIQTDAAINPGNSGGALVNIDGELVGINTMIITPSGAFAGIGLAIPISMAKWIMQDLIYEGKVARGWLGVEIQNVDQATKDALGLDEDAQGVLISNVIKDQPAARAGMKRGDVVLSVDEKPVKDANELRNLVASLNPGKKVPVMVIRNGKQITLQVQLTQRDEGKVAKIGSNEEKESSASTSSDQFEKFGMEVANLTAQNRKDYGIDEEVKGVVITNVEQTGQAAAEGLRVGDVIKEVKIRGRDQAPVYSVEEFKKIARPVKEGESIMLFVDRKGQSFFVAFKAKK